MAEYAKIYKKFLEREQIVGLTVEEEGMKSLVEAVLISAMTSLEDRAIKTGSTVTEYELDVLRNLLTPSVVR